MLWPPSSTGEGNPTSNLQKLHWVFPMFWCRIQVLRIEDFSATNSWMAYPGPVTNDGTFKMQTQSFFFRTGGFSPDILLMEEILHQLIWVIISFLQGFIHVRWCRISSINRISLFLRIHNPILVPTRLFWLDFEQEKHIISPPNLSSRDFFRNSFLLRNINRNLHVLLQKIGVGWK